MFTRTRLIIGIAALMFVVTWGRLAALNFANPSPFRIMDVIIPGRQVDANAFACTRQAIIEDETIWRFCNTPEGRYFFQLDPNSGTVSSFGGRVERVAMGSRPEAFVFNDQRELLTLVTVLAPDAQDANDTRKAFVIVSPEHGTSVMGIPADAPAAGAWIGVDWVGDGIEAVFLPGEEDALPEDVTAIVYGYDRSDGWQAGRVVEDLPECGEDCTFSHAHLTDDGWQFVFTIREESGPIIDAFTSDEAGTLTPIPLETTADPAPVDRFDVAASNMLNVTRGQRDLYRLEDGALRWIPMSANNAGLIWATTVRDGPDGEPLTERPEVEFETTYRLDGTTFLLEERRHDIHLRRDGDAESERLLLRDTISFAANWRTGYVTLTPSAESGGYWLVNATGQYLHVDDDLRRTDPLSFPQRVGRLFDNFDIISGVLLEGSPYGSPEFLKQIALAAILFFYPLGYVGLVLYLSIRQRRLTLVDGETLRGFSTLYIGVFVLSVYWFWRLSAVF